MQGAGGGKYFRFSIDDLRLTICDWACCVAVAATARTRDEKNVEYRISNKEYRMSKG